MVSKECFLDSKDKLCVILNGKCCEKYANTSCIMDCTFFKKDGLEDEFISIIIKEIDKALINALKSTL